MNQMFGDTLRRRGFFFDVYVAFVAHFIGAFVIKPVVGIPLYFFNVFFGAFQVFPFCLFRKFLGKF